MLAAGGGGGRVVPARQARVARRQGLLDGRVRDDGGRCRRRRRSPASRGRRTATTRERLRFAQRHLARAAVQARLDVPRAEPRRVPARRRLRPALLREQRGRDVRDRREEREARLEATTRTAASPSSPALDRHVVYETFLNAPPCNRKPSASLTGEVIAFAVGTAACSGGARSGRPSRRRSSSAASVFVGDWNGRVWALRRATGKPRWVTKLQGQVKGGVAISGNRLYVGDYSGICTRSAATSGKIALAGEGAAAVRRHRQLLRDTGGRVRARVHRRDRRQGVLVRRGEREAALVAVDGRLRLLVDGGLARPRLRRLVLAAVLLLRRGDRRRSSGSSRRTGRSPARRR